MFAHLAIAELQECRRRSPDEEKPSLQMLEQSQPQNNSPSQDNLGPPPAKKGRGGKRTPLWQVHHVALLINLIKTNWERLCGKEEKRTPVYCEITEVMQEVFPGVTREQVQKKWRNIKARFFEYESNRKISGGQNLIPPSHHALLSTFLGDNDSIANHQIPQNNFGLLELAEEPVFDGTSLPSTSRRLLLEGGAVPSSSPPHHPHRSPQGTICEGSPILSTAQQRSPQTSPQQQDYSSISSPHQGQHRIPSPGQTDSPYVPDEEEEIARTTAINSEQQQFLLRTRRRTIQTDIVLETLSKNVKTLVNEMRIFRKDFKESEQQLLRDSKERLELLRAEDERAQAKELRAMAKEERAIRLDALTEEIKKEELKLLKAKYRKEHGNDE